MKKEEFTQLRENLGLTQSELAEKIGISRSTIAKIESGTQEVSYKVESKLLTYIKDLKDSESLNRHNIINEAYQNDLISEDDLKEIENNSITYADTYKIKTYLKYKDNYLNNITENHYNSIIDLINNINTIFNIAEKLKITNDDYFNTKFDFLGDPKKYILNSINQYNFNELKFDNTKIKAAFKLLILENIKDDLEVYLTSRIKYLHNALELVIK